MSFLTSTQIKQYKDEGYVSPIDALSKDEALEIREEIEIIEKKIGDYDGSPMDAESGMQIYVCEKN